MPKAPDAPSDRSTAAASGDSGVRRFARTVLLSTLVALVSVLCAAGLWGFGLLERLEYPTWSWRVRAFSRHESPSDRIVLILVDQESLDWGKRAMGLPWPWPREAYSHLLEFCRRGGAANVALDILYTEPSFFGEEDDAVFGAALARSRNVIVSVFAGRSGDTDRWPAGVSRRLCASSGDVGSAREDWVAQRAAFPVPAVATNATAIANVAGDPDLDGVVRRIAPFRLFDGKAIPALGFASALLDSSAGSGSPPWRVERRALRVGGRSHPLGRDGRMILRFKGVDGRHRHYGADAVIRSTLQLNEGRVPELDPSVVSNACVLIGFSAPGLMDVRSSPISRVLPGTEVHATLLDNLLCGDMLADAPVGGVVAVVFALAWWVACGGLRARSVFQSLGVLGLAGLASAVLAYAAYAVGFWWPWVMTALAVSVAWVAGSAVNFATEGRQRLFLKSAFRQYLGAEVIEQILADPSRLRLGGERRSLTVFFSDIEGFTGISERLSPEALTGLLNLYLSAMGDIIKEEGGYVDKYIGDAIVAFWNAPLAQEDHAVRACRAAVRCQQVLAERQAEFVEVAGGAVRMRIGVHTGDVVVGNMGSRARFNYTILGDAANVSSRLEGANKAFGTYTMVSEETWRLTGALFVGRPLARLRLVGRQKPVEVHELRGMAGDMPGGAWTVFAEGLALFRQGRFEAAAQVFAREPQDPASVAYAARCAALGQRPPQAWDGTWELTSK